MTDEEPAAPVQPAMAPPPSAEAASNTCLLSGDFLPPNFRKHIDPKVPVALRMMAAKSLVPMAPSDMMGALYILTFDPDQAVRETAQKTAATLADRILATGARDERVQPIVLGYFLDLFAEKDTYAEMLILNASTPDEAVARAARRCSAKIAEIIGQNQLRLLRHENIIRQLCQNPAGSPALLDGVCDFAVRSGVALADVPQMKTARIRLFGPEAAEKLPEPGPSAADVIGEFKELAEEGGGPIEEGKRLTLTQRVMKMNIAEKIKLATLGNKEARAMLIRDSNKLVAVAVIRSPRITDGEVLQLSNNRAANDEVLRIIYNNREWTKIYPVKLALVKNPKIPMTVAMKFLATLRESEIKDLARDKNVPSGIQMFAKKMMEKKNAPKKDDK